MTFVLLHKTHGLEEWMVLCEGTAGEVQEFLNSHARYCRQRSHFRVVKTEPMTITTLPLVATFPIFYVKEE